MVVSKVTTESGELPPLARAPRATHPNALKRWGYNALRGWFMLSFAASVVLTNVATRVVHALFFLSKTQRESISARVAHYGFRLIFGLNPHITFEYADEGEPAWDELFSDESAGSPFLMVNHTSQLDSLVFSALVPTHAIARMRTLAKSGLFDLPVFGWILRACGHFPVYFQRAEKMGDFSVDKDKQEKVSAAVQSHIEGGGGITLFPEGQIGREDTKKLQSFRRGAFESCARKTTMQLWGFLHTGVDSAWPSWTGVGGFPSHIRFKLFKLPQPPHDGPLADYVDHCQKIMQLELDLMHELDNPDATFESIRERRAALEKEVLATADGDADVARQLRAAVDMEPHAAAAAEGKKAQ